VSTRIKTLVILGILGILASLLPTLVASAGVAGVVTVTGGSPNQDVQWFSLQTAFRDLTVQVDDADKNVASTLANGVEVVDSATFTSGIGGSIGAGTTYTVSNTPFRTSGLGISALQDGTIYPGISSLTPSTGVIVMGSATKEGTVYKSLFTTDPTVASAGAFAALTLRTASPPSAGLDAATHLKFTIQDLAANAGAATTGIQIRVTGNLVNKYLQNILGSGGAVETTAVADTVTYTLADVADNTTGASFFTADLWNKITLVEVTASATGAGGYKVSAAEIFSIGITYTYDSAQTIASTRTSITSTNAPASVALALVESSATSGLFRATVRLTDDISLNGTVATGTIKYLYVKNGDLITPTYNDEDPVAAKTPVQAVRVDLTAPVVTLTGPTHNSFVKVATQIFKLTVTDADVADGKAAGLTDGDLLLKVPFGTDVTANTFKARPSTNAVEMTFNDTTSRAEGALEWIYDIKDKVGNAPVGTDGTTTSAVRGTLGAKYKVTYDTAAPTILDGSNKTETGFALTDAGLTTEAQTDNVLTSVRVKFDLGTGGAPLDAATVAASDFTVAGSGPSAATVNTVAVTDCAIGQCVYLTVPSQSTDAKPEIKIVGSISDKAGNAQTTGTVTAAGDKLRPVLTVTSSAALSKTSVVITVSSSELLNATPTIQAGGAPANGALTAFQSTKAVKTFTVTATGTTSYTATYTVGSTTFGLTAGTVEAQKVWVLVAGTDLNGNAKTLGDALSDAGAALTTDVITFQADNKPSTVAVTPTTASAGQVRIGLVFNEDEYTGDTNKTVTVTKATLETLTAAGGTVTASADVLAALFSTDKISYTLAKTLDVGSYNLKVEFADAAGNAGTSLVNALAVTAVPKVVIALQPGLNLISLPGTPKSTAINDIITAALTPVDLVVAYDPTAANPYGVTATRSATTGLLAGTLTTLVPGKIYWVRSTAFVDISVDIPALDPLGILPTIPVKGGVFNGVGVWLLQTRNLAGTADIVDIDADQYFGAIKWRVAYAFNPDPSKGWQAIRPNTDDVVTKGRGYLVYVTTDDVLTP